MGRNIWHVIVRLAGIFAVALILPRSLSAATLTVTDLGDSGAPGQLRTLINQAAFGDTIVIPPGTITLTGAADENENASGDLDIRKDLTIQGAGAGTTIIDGGGIDRVFHIFSFGTNVAISRLTIRNGNPGFLESGFLAVGGGIRNSVTLTLAEVALTGNTAVIGGGIANAGKATLTNVIISGNTASGDGGGIANLLVPGSDPTRRAALTLTNGTVSGNASGTGGSGNGGGIVNFNTATLTLTNITVTGNTSSANGGGIYNEFIATLTNVTLSGNTASGGAGMFNNAITTLTNVTLSSNSGTAGGGLFNAGQATLTNVTLSGNSSMFEGGGIQNRCTMALTNVTLNANSAGFGGTNIDNLSTCSAAPTLRNTIVTGGPAGINCVDRMISFPGPNPKLTSLGHNLSSDASCGFSGPGDMTNTNPLLGPLQNNGGPTQTHALLPGSPAINGGTNSGCPATDQRGIARPQGGTCDIGAFEFGVIVAAVQLNGSSFHTSQQIAYQATVNPGFTPTQVDVYTGALLPDLVTFLSLVQISPGVISVAIGPAPVPFLANATLAPLTVSFQYTFAGPEPVGTYVPYAGLMVAGSNPFLPANQLSLAIQPFQFTP